MVVADHLTRYDLDLPTAQKGFAIDAIVRIVLSHVMQPSGRPARRPTTAWRGSPGGSCTTPCPA